MSNIIISPESGILEFNNNSPSGAAIGSATAPIRLDATGGNSFITGSNFGIGTSEPQFTLDVDGSIHGTSGNFQTAITVGGNPVMTGASPEADTLQTVTARGATSNQAISVSNIVTSNEFVVGNQGKVNSSSTVGLQLQSTSTNKPIKFLTNVAGQTERMRIEGDGKVGIGTTSPDSKLHVELANAALGFDQGITIQSNPSDFTAGRGGGIIMKNADVTTAGIFGIRQANNYEGALLFYTHTVGIGNTFDTTFTEKMRIESDGNVGIGATEPSVGLQLGNSTSGQTKTAIFNSEGGAEVGLTIKSRTNRAKLAVSDNDTTAYVVAEGTIASFGRSDTAASTNISVLADGNVGIGSTSPSRLLTLENNSSTVSNNSQLRINNIGAGDAYIYLFAGSDWSLGIDNSDSDKFKLCTSNDVSDGNEVVTVDRSGNVGIGTTSPDAKLKVQSDATSTDSNTLRITHSRSDADVATNAAFIDMNLSGADNTTADRANAGLKIDLDSSANGDADNEHRIYGVDSDVRFNGFSDVARGGYFYTESNYTGGKTAQLAALYANATHDANSTSGGVSNMYGVFATSSIQDLGDVDNAFGGYFRVIIPEGRAANVDITKGVEGAVRIDKSTAIDYGSMIGVSSIIDNNEDSTPNFGTQYLFKGDYQGTRGSNAYGIHVEGDKNYFEGNVGIGIVNPAAKLHIGPDSLVSGYTSTRTTLAVSDTANGAELILRGQSPRIWFDTTAGGMGEMYLDGAQLNVLSGRPTSVGSSRLYIKAGGDVGIGTTDPSSKLHVESTSTSSIRAYNGSHYAAMGANTNAAWITAGGSPTHGLRLSAGANGAMSVYASRGVAIGEYPTTDPGADNFTVAGNVGIGTTNPSDNLTVEGGGITLGGTGRIQGIDTVSASTDAANKAYVDAQVGSADTLQEVTDNGNTFSADLLYTNSGTAQKISNNNYNGLMNFNASRNIGFHASTADVAHIHSYSETHFKFGSSHNSANTTAMIVKSNGNVGIGTTIPSQLLHVNSSTSNPTGIGLQNSQRYYSVRSNNFSLAFTDETVGSERMRIDSSGNVGIGTTGPSGELHVKNVAELYTSLAGSDAAVNFVDGQGDVWRAGIRAADNSFRFCQSATSLGTNPRVTIADGGNVGIGTTGPSNKLEIKGSGGGTDVLNLNKGTGQGGLKFTFNGTNFVSYIRTHEANAVADNFMALGVSNGNNTTGAEVMRLKGDGKVGIGTTNPSQKLDVVGHIEANTTNANFRAIDGSVITKLQSQTVGGPSQGVIGTESANNLAIVTSNQTRMFVNTSGNVGIGTTNPIANLHVNGDVQIGNSTNPNSFGALQVNQASNVDEAGIGVLSASAGRSIRIWVDETRSYINSGNGGSGILVLNEGAGSVGIGTTNPSDQDLSINAPKLHVLGPSTTGAFNLVARFQGGNDNDNTGAAILINHSNDRGLLINAGRADSDREVAYFNLVSSGANITNMLTLRKVVNAYNVGVGTTNPTTKLHIDDDASLGTGLTVLGGGGGGPLATFTRDVGSTGTVAINASSGMPQIRFATNNTFALGVNNTTFEIADNATIGGTNTRFSITNTGNIGIGTLFPAYNLTIADALTSTPKTLLHFDANNITNGGGYNIDFRTSSNDTADRYVARIRGIREGNGATSQLSFWTENSGLFQRMTIKADGNVGIGTTNPSSKLHVAGDQYVTGQIGQGVAIANKIAAYGAEFRSTNASAQIFFGRDGGSVGSGAIGADATYLLKLFKTNNFSTPFVITQSGNVGINKTSPAQKLDVGAGHIRLDAGYSLQWDNSHERIEQSDGHLEFFVNNTEGMTLDTNGLGIGTTAPEDKLDIVGNLRICSSKTANTNKTNRIRGEHYNVAEEPTTFMFMNSFSATNQLHIGGGSSVENAATLLSFFTAANNTTVAGTERMRIDSAGKIQIGNNIPMWSGSYGGALFLKGNNSTSDRYAQLTEVNSTGAATSTGLVVRAGNVGIGTVSPTEKLHVEGNIELINNGSIGSLDGNYWQRIRFEDGSPSTTNAFNFETRNGAGSFIDHMVIRNDGNVGIGTTNPQASLHVAGYMPITPTGNGVLMGLYTSGSSNYGNIQLNGDTGSFIDFSSSGQIGKDVSYTTIHLIT